MQIIILPILNTHYVHEIENFLFLKSIFITINSRSKIFLLYAIWLEPQFLLAQFGVRLLV